MPNNSLGVQLQKHIKSEYTSTSTSTNLWMLGGIYTGTSTSTGTVLYFQCAQELMINARCRNQGILTKLNLN